ncbi:MAG: exodeoxyribonuclease VII large subunit [Nitrospirae bacterium]|nr:exodeoxyribonuclease VII large subunit [Nitrospirota bacterium]
MIEKANNKTIFSLLEITQSIQTTLSERYKSPFWIKAEMSKLNYYPLSGHCYPELVEKKDGKVIAQIKSNLWKDDYMRISNNFQKVLKEPLKDGIKILFSARITYDPVYGLGLRIIDIDPSFSLGELEREKLETIEKIKKEGIFNKNKEHKIPLLPQRIAIISVETSKGYADFLKVINDNPSRYKFFHFLFPALLQGEKAVESISSQLKRIKKVIHHFDVVAIIRGGGGDIGLSCYNNFFLSREVALFPIPVITGIGHATNETVIEMIAYENAITPTALGGYLLQKFHNFSDLLQKSEEKLIDKTKRIIKDEKREFQYAVRCFCSLPVNMLIKNNNEINVQFKTLLQQSNFFYKNIKQQIKQIIINLKKDVVSHLNQTHLAVNNYEKSISIMSPINILKRGYTITLLNGAAIKSYQQVKEGDILNTLVVDGNIISNVKSVKKSDEL